jgi:MFS family permease
MGSGLAGFALAIWVYQRTGSVTKFALIALSTTRPGLLLSPLAGALVDRWDRRWAMILSDFGAGLCAFVIALLLLIGQLELWHIYVLLMISAICSSFQWPAYTASITLLVPQRHLGRANGMVQLGQASAQIIAPVLAGILIMAIQIEGIILIDVLTFIIALITLLIARIPNAQLAAASEEVGRSSLIKEAVYGWTYIARRSGLLWLLVFLGLGNLLAGIVSVLAVPLILSFAPPSVVGAVMSVAGIGMLVSSLIMTAWGGGKRHINSVMGFMMLEGLGIMLVGLRPSALLIGFAGFIIFFCLPIINGSNLAIWQSKVVPSAQGRVFAVSRMIAGLTMPVAYLIAGPLADRVFEPLLAIGGVFSSSIGRFIGVGPGRGIGLMFIVVGLLTMLITAVSYLYPRLRLVEDELPDAAPSQA